ncbi:GIY-YIG nuclease family protein [Coraliomargarita algicola]|uniref:GIY-YIG nuclease family protein n=1 Tax=Coraliomargarita algicola TaxID=3092156 RepID=UPI0031F32993
MFYVYVLQSQLDQGLYIGYTGNLRRRLFEHNTGEARATSFRRPWKLIYYVAYLIEEDAMRRERFLKSGAGRRHIDKQLRRYFERHPRA